MDISWTAVVPIIVLAVGFIAFCLVDLSRSDVKFLSKWVWALVCIVSVPFGGVVYLMVGREPGSSR